MDAVTNEAEVPSAKAGAPKPEPKPDPEPTMPEATAALMDATIADMIERQVQERLAKMLPPPHLGQQVDMQHAAFGALLVDPRSLPPPAEAAPAELESFAVTLPPRFAEYLRRRAEAHGHTVNEHLGGIVRWFWQQDTWRQSFTAPSAPGQAAGTSLRT
jgi:hypothetical protein